LQFVVIAHHDQLDTRWEGPDLVVLLNDGVVDRIAVSEIRRVIMVCDHGDRPSDLRFAVIDTGTEHVILPAESGIAGRVHFERQAFWGHEAGVYWVAAPQAPLPRHLRPGLWLLRRHRPAYIRLPASELGPVIEQWPLEGPQTWEQRKWARIAAGQMLAPAVKKLSPTTNRKPG
jgi:hypothetical protein